MTEINEEHFILIRQSRDNGFGTRNSAIVSIIYLKKYIEKFVVKYRF